MTGMKLAGLFAVPLLVTTAVIAQPPSGGRKGGPNKQICRVFVDTGSRLGRYRACHTAEQWSDQHDQTKQNVDHIQNARPWNICPPYC